MTTCYICGSSHFTETLVDEMFNIDGKYILVEAIPAKVCSQCGEVLFSSETAENVRLKVQSQSPNKSISIDVFAY
ncbi:MAG: YgiT-type zinc finger protein [Microcystaceae cyanobacterium]